MGLEYGWKGSQKRVLAVKYQPLFPPILNPLVVFHGLYGSASVGTATCCRELGLAISSSAAAMIWSAGTCSSNAGGKLPDSKLPSTQRVVTSPFWKSGCDRTACKKSILVVTPWTINWRK